MICFQLDDFIKTKHAAYYVLRLEDGRFIYQDDLRYGETDKAWLRIKEFLEQERVKVESIWIHFYSNCAEVLNLKDIDYDGLFFCNQASQDIMGMEYAGQQLTQHAMRFGYVKDSVLHYTQWKVPEVLHERSGTAEKFNKGLVIDGPSKTNRLHNEAVCEVEENSTN